MEPLEYLGYINPVSVVNTYTPGYCLGPYASYYSTIPFTPYHADLPVPSTTPLPGGIANSRYAITGYTGTSGSHNEANLTLHKDMVNGGVYNLSFEYYMCNYPLPWTTTGSPAAAFTGQFHALFNSTQFTGQITPPSPPTAGLTVGPTFSWGGIGTWQNYTISGFTHSGSTGDNYLRIIYPHLGTPQADYLLFDNVSLVRDLTPTITYFPMTLPATLTATVPGGGVSYQWYQGTNPTVIGTSSTLAVSSWGIYKVVVSDGCGCTAEQTINFHPCPSFSEAVGGDPTHLTGTITSLPPNAYNAYYVTGTLNINAPLNLTNCSFLMEGNSAIYVNSQVLLTIEDSSHLATCPDSTEMWQGISLATDWGHVHVTGGSLIEDASVAISATNMMSIGHYDSTTYPYLIYTDNAIFNRNHEAIHIQNHMDSNLTGRYRFVNTIFTSRAMASDFKNWPKPSLLKNTGVPLGYDTLLPPYVLNGWYNKAMAKDGSPSYVGIVLRETGYSKSLGSTYYKYFGIHVGDEGHSDYRNVFDNMRNGIESYNSNLYVYQSTFSDHYEVSGWGGMGIYSWTDHTNYIRQLGVKTSAAGYAVGLGNEFFENYIGVEASHNWEQAVVRARIRTSNTNLALGGIGHTGIRMNGYSYRSMRADSKYPHGQPRLPYAPDAAELCSSPHLCGSSSPIRLTG